MIPKVLQIRSSFTVTFIAILCFVNSCCLNEKDERIPISEEALSWFPYDSTKSVFIFKNDSGQVDTLKKVRYDRRTAARPKNKQCDTKYLYERIEIGFEHTNPLIYKTTYWVWVQDKYLSLVGHEFNTREKTFEDNTSQYCQSYQLKGRSYNNVLIYHYQEQSGIQTEYYSKSKGIFAYKDTSGTIWIKR